MVLNCTHDRSINRQQVGGASLPGLVLQVLVLT